MMSPKEWIVSFVMLGVVSIVHMLIPAQALSLHTLLRVLYFIPVLYASIQGGKRPALIISSVALLLFLPHFFMAHATAEFHVGNVTAIILLFVVSFIVGGFRDTSRRSYQIVRHSRLDLTGIPIRMHVLFYVDESDLSLLAADWYLGFFKEIEFFRVTLFAVLPTGLEDVYETERESTQKRDQLSSSKTAFLERIRRKLVDNGVPEEDVWIRLAQPERNQRASDVVLGELQTLQYDFALLPRHEITKAQEFLFGDVAVRIVREAPVPVVVIKGFEPKEEPQAL
ncbi:universal stress protein [Desulfocurvibacter africanus]|uniref:universal stress protein n=1 Tax=Desulfocurvibacter africanus TaxID=873 RepID=UPI0004876692|nr:universal stress protein [Desulfocurvibacter africanus]